MKLTSEEILVKYSNMAPGKYWSLPSNKKYLLEDYLKNENYFPMIKYDGYWSRIIITEDDVLIQSRGISKTTGTYGDYTPLVPHIVEELKKYYPANTVLLGELAFNDLSRKANEVGTILRCKPDKAILRQKEEKNKIHLFLFDVLVYDGEEILDLPFKERFIPRHTVALNSLYTHVATSSNSENASAMLEYVWSEGGEGIILVNKNLPYNIGNAKAWHSIKVKREMKDVEGKIVDIIKPNKVYEGKSLDSWIYWVDKNDRRLDSKEVFSMVLIEGLTPVTKPYYFNRAVGVVVDYLGRTVNITSGTTEEDGEYLITDEAQELIRNGSLYAVFTGMEVTTDSVRHPRLLRIRDDIK